MRKGVLLLNLGTPDQCDQRSVSRYLREFLLDPRVIDLPFYIRWPLVNFFIIPFRCQKTTAAYQKVWDIESPLLKHSNNLVTDLSQILPDYEIALGMRYGQPNIQSALQQLKYCEQVAIIPLFPQYSSAATGSALEKTLQAISQQWNIPSIKIKTDFYNDAEFISAYAEIIKTHLIDKKIDLLLFSYHGLPERHIDKSECVSTCDRTHACPAMDARNRFCYRAQCYATSRSLAEALQLQPQQYQVAFQSRLGRTPWIKPYTDLQLPQFISQGIKNIAIVCPSFVADCLETLEEINIRAREQWMSLGGESFTFIPCLNNHPAWVKGLGEMIADLG